MPAWNGWEMAPLPARPDRVLVGGLRGLRGIHKPVRPRGGTGMIAPAQAARTAIERLGAAMTLA